MARSMHDGGSCMAGVCMAGVCMAEEGVHGRDGQ